MSTETIVLQDEFIGFANGNGPGSTFTRSITVPDGAIDPHGDGTLTLQAFGDFNWYGEYVAVSIEGIDLGRFLDNQPGNDRFDHPSDVGNQYGATFSGTATLTEAELAAILADGVVEVTYTLSPQVHNLSNTREEFLKVELSFEYSAGEPWQQIASIDGGFEFTGFEDAEYGYELTGDTVADAFNMIAWTLDANGDVIQQPWAQGYVDDLGTPSLAGDDLITTSNQADHIEAGAGNDTVHARDGDDFVQGNRGDDELHGEDGNDTIRGGKDDDELYGGEGDDDLYGDKGNDHIWTGNGADEVFFPGTSYNDGDDSLDVVWDFQVGTDTVVDQSGVLTLASGDASNTGAYNAAIGQWGTLLQAEGAGGEVDQVFLVGVGVDPADLGTLIA